MAFGVPRTRSRATTISFPMVTKFVEAQPGCRVWAGSCHRFIGRLASDTAVLLGMVFSYWRSWRDSLLHVHRGQPAEARVHPGAGKTAGPAPPRACFHLAAAPARQTWCVSLAQSMPANHLTAFRRRRGGAGTELQAVPQTQVLAFLGAYSEIGWRWPPQSRFSPLSDHPSPGAFQLVEQQLCCFEIGGGETLGEPAVNRC
jgi:hypothetical protein